MAYYDIGEVFQKIEEDMIASMSRNLKRHLRTEKEEDLNYTMWQAEQLAALDAFRKNNKKAFKSYFKTINSQIDEVLRKANETGLMDQEVAILEAIKKGWSAPHKSGKSEQLLQGEFFKINESKLNALIEATQHDMSKAETAMLRQADDEYRKIIFNSQAYYNTGAGTLSQCVDMATKDFLSRGISCIEYANGARVGVDSYSRMALRTAQTRAYLQGESAKRDEWGVNTVIVNKRGVACPRCLKYVGKVFYDDVWGSTPVPTPAKYPRLSDAIAGGLYHPNCKDIHTTYFEDVNTPPEPMTKEQKEEAARVYDLEQEQRYNERQIRKYKRLTQGSVDPENQLKYQQKTEEWQARQKAFVKANGDVLKRRYDNEKLRVPDFPEPPSLEAFDKVDNKNLQSVNKNENKRGIIKCKDGHKYIETVTKQPSCTETGEKVFTCSVCGDHYTEEIPALGHDLISSIIAPTCTEKGYTLKKCQRPGCSHEEKTDVVPALGHDIRISVYDPTCTAESYTIKWCTRCSHREKTDIKPALGHDWGDWVITRQPTTALEGRKKRVCKRCGISGYGSIPKLKAPSISDQIKALQDSLTKLQGDIDDLNKTTYSNIWKDPVTVSDYPYKKTAIAAKKQYFMDQLSKATDPAAQSKWQSLLDLTDEYDIKGQEYERLFAERQKNQDALDLLRPQTAGAASGPFTADAYTQARKNAAIWTTDKKYVDSKVRDKTGQLWRKSTPAQRGAAHKYTSGSGSFNRPLRGYQGSWNNFKGIGKVDLDYEGSGQAIKELTDMIDKSTYDYDMWLNRGVENTGTASFLGISESDLRYKSQAELEKMLLGTVREDAAFLSTGAAKGSGFPGNVFKIYAPKGTKMLYCEPFSAYGGSHAGTSWDGISPQSYFGSEFEMLIQRGTKFKITKVEKQGGKLYIDMEVVGQI